ncbi:MAG: hypothetical protein HY269_03945 [Deltaproteobacteria bacterium]|nr:hypothetical protein [Deltaproteobacteria bacterium]
MTDLFRRFVALGISRHSEAANAGQWKRTRGMRLGRYFMGAGIILILAVALGRTFFIERPLLALTLVASYAALVIYGGVLKYRDDKVSTTNIS